MSKKLYLSFLWHMHQPYYKNDVTNTTLMPWVFLHAIKDYYDMPWYLSQHPSIKATFNLVPSLLEQIESYIDGTANDKFLTILEKEVNHLNESDIKMLEEYLFLANSENMIKPFARYHALFQKYKAHQESLKSFSLQELQDVQILFLLSWCGNYLREKSEMIKELIDQQENFTHIQKIKLLGTLFDFVTEIIPYYKALMRLEQIALSTTPFYHPILPLLIDREKSAKAARWDVKLPKTEANYSDFARLHLQKAVDYFEETFNQKPKGMWPSEGSVSQKTAEMISEYEVEWICSDEEILFKTLKSDDRKNLYKPYTIQNANGKPINIFFRDRYLSDRIGFEYSKKSPKEAAYDFISHLKKIYENSENGSLVSVILDGENAWEFYANNGKDFFDELYLLLQNQTWCETVFFNEIDQIQDLKKVPLTDLAAGSWINGNFDIWIGHREKNAAWELLDGAKVVYDKLKATFNPETLEQIDKEFMIALGSDWFWWYGDDHYTSLKAQFDEEFRTHIRNIYELMEKEPPHNLSVPIVTKQSKTKETFFSQPTGTISPMISGKVNSFYEWFGSGLIDLKKELTTMDRSLHIEAINYGTDLDKNIYFLFKLKNPQRITENSVLKIYLNEKSYDMPIQSNTIQSFDDNVRIELGFKEAIELKIEGFDRNTIDFAFELFDQDQVILQKFPLYETFLLHLHNHSLKRWNLNAGESKSEFRYCKLTKEWTLFAPERLKRPDDVNNKVKKHVRDGSDSCPFDHGKEDLTPKEIARIEDHNGWRCRVVPNLYNALSIDGSPKSIKDSFFDKFTGFGAHEVLIETPNHEQQIWDYSFDDFYNYFSLMQKRVIGLQNDKRFACLSIFKNHGEGAGASLIHSHSQIIALPFVPKKLKEEIARKLEHYETFKRSMLDDAVYEETAYGKNIVAENSDFIIYCPYASKFEFEAKIVAKKPLSSLAEFTSKDITALSDIIKDFFKRFHNALGDIPFNMIIKNAPYENYSEKTKEYFRFHINILPRIYKNAGFELDSDIYINLILPENATKIYKENL
ncbi:MAG: DUF4931 domain-containing protein [Campylobacterales bacterium]|nr:DUF4931 domain-containing protein [Campylobacterales bacterium]